MAFVFRPSNARPRGQNCDFWRHCRYSLINSPVFRGLCGCLGIEAPNSIKADSLRPPRGLSLPAFTSQHSGKVRRQGPPLAEWGQATLWGQYLGKGSGKWDGGWHVSELSFGVEWNGFCFQTLKHTSKGSKM